MEKKYLSTKEAAQKIGISRQAILKKIQAKEIITQKVGRGYIIAEEAIPAVMSKMVTEAQKRGIDKSVSKTVREYGEALKMLGKE